MLNWEPVSVCPRRQGESFHRGAQRSESGSEIDGKDLGPPSIAINDQLQDVQRLTVT
jgi:hypothetical protein